MLILFVVMLIDFSCFDHVLELFVNVEYVGRRSGVLVNGSGILVQEAKTGRLV